MGIDFPRSSAQTGLSMPSAVPGLGGGADSIFGSPPGGPPPGAGGASLMGALPPPGGSPLTPTNANIAGLGMPMPGDPSSQQYAAKTQQDGTVLLHLMMPDGSLGPAVKIISLGAKPKPAAV